jgi:pimeloyl-ACP methyl ester carboxylesterase
MITQPSLSASQPVHKSRAFGPLPAVGRLLSLAARISPTLAGRCALPFFTRTSRPPRSERETELLKTARRFELMQNIVAWEWSSHWTAQGKVVLLVHGWNGRGAQLGEFAAPLVARGFRVVAFDARGHGESAGNHATLTDFRDAIMATERHYGRLHAVVTHSFGGAAALLALRRGLQLNGLVLIAPPADPKAAVSRFADLTSLSSEAEQALADRLQSFLPASDLDLCRTAREALFPLLVVHDRGDGEIRWRDGKTLAQAAPLGSFHLTHGLGHYMIVRNSDVIHHVSDFVASVQVDSRQSDLEQRLNL